MKITIYGPGCMKCKQAEEIVRRVVAETDSTVEVTKVSDFQEMATAGVMMTPAIAVDGVIKIAGRVPKPEEVKQWITG
ncbi:MAG: thioredoxin family protein [bacterium]